MAKDKPDYNKMFSEMEAQMGSPFADPAGIPGGPISGNIVDGDDNPVTEDHGDHHHHADGTIHPNEGAPQQGGNINITRPFLILQFDHEPTDEPDTVRIVGMNINGGNGMPEDKDAFIHHLKAAVDMLENNPMVKGGE